MVSDKNRDYWRKREEEHQQVLLAKSADYERETARIYNQSYRDIDTKIQAFYQRYADKNEISLAEARLRASKTDVQALADTAKRLVEQRDFGGEANEVLSRYNLTMKTSRLELLKHEIALELAKNGEQANEYIAKTLTKEALAEAKRQAGILGLTRDTAKVSNVKSIVDGSFHNAKFSERIWSNIGALQNQLDTFLTQSISNGRHPNDVARDVKKMFSTSQKNAERLLRTESARVHAELAKESYRENGIAKYEWVAEPGACERCGALDGRVFEVKDAGFGDTKSPLFPVHPSCRCGSIPWLDEDEYNEWLDRFDDESARPNFVEVDDELEKELQANSDKWVKNLSQDELESVEVYTSTGHEDLNHILRDSKSNYFEDYSDEEIQTFWWRTGQLDEALSKSTLQQDIVTYRGMSRKEHSTLLNGDRFDDYKSTSISEQIAKGFDARYVVKFKIPAGTQGAYLGSNSTVPGEKEFLLGRGSKYTAKLVDDVLEVTIVGREPKAIPKINSRPF